MLIYKTEAFTIIFSWFLFYLR